LATRIPLPLGFNESENLPRTKRVLLNGWNDGNGKFVGRPGISQKNTTGKVARGNFVWNGNRYNVVSQSLIKFTNNETGAFTTNATPIEGSEPVKVAIGFNDAVIVVPGGKSYTLSKTDVVTDTSGNANFESWADVCHINGRFIYIPFDGTPAKFSDVGAAGTIQALSFFDAEELPDKNNGCFATPNNVLAITGTDSIEFFRDSGATPNPFLRVNGARIANGFIGALQEYNQTFLFIGREKDQDFGIYSIAQGIAPKISNQGIDLILSTYTIAELAEAIPGRIKWRGFDIATFTLRRDSFGYFGGEWFLLDTIFNQLSSPWGGGFIAQFEGKYYTAFDDKIGRFENIATDYGNRITRRILTGVEEENGDYMTFQKIQLGISQGFNVADGSVAVKLSRDNVLFGQPVYRNTSDIGKYADHLEWNYPGGLGGPFHGFLGIEFFTTEDILSSVEYIILK